MRKRLSLLGLSIAFLAMTPVLAEACSCIPSGPPCQAVWETPAVFAGTVIEVDQAPGALGPRRVRFRITEAFRGIDGAEIEIHLRGSGGASCDPAFRLGESWLVYASQQQAGAARWTTSTCARTRRMSMAADDLTYLRMPDQEKPPSHIEGQVVRQTLGFPQSGRGESVPLAGVRVTATSGATRLEAKTDGDGRYRIPVDAFRAYQIDFGRRADGLVIQSDREQVLLRHHLACAVINAYAR